MKCKKCNKEMELKEVGEDWLGDEVMCLREEFLCPACNLTAILNAFYEKTSEEVEYSE